MILNDRALIIEDGNIITYCKGKLYWRQNFEEKPVEICKLPTNRLTSFFSLFQLGERLLRLEPRFAIPFKNGSFYLSYNHGMYLVDINSKRIRRVHEYRENMHNPLNVCIVKDLKGFEDGMYYGEYWGNSSHEEVSIFRGEGDNWEKVYSFAPGTISHIHSIQADYVNNCMIILTGDSDSESGIWIAEDSFQRVRKVCGNSQQFRSCIALFNDNYMFFPTDTPLEQNYFNKYSVEKRIVENRFPIAGPCIYGGSLLIGGKQYLVFSTSVEPDSDMAGTWKYRLSTKPGPGVSDRYTHVYITDSVRIGELYKAEKDRFPYQLFQFGTVRFPYQKSSDWIGFSFQSIKKLHGKTMMIRAEDAVKCLERGEDL